MQQKDWLDMAVEAVAGFEGLRTEAYLDAVGVPTIGYGHTKGVKMGDTLTKEECKALLVDELEEFGQQVSDAVKVTLSPEERAGYTSFAYNVGIGAFRKSTLLRKLNTGDRVGAADELPRWVYAGGKKLNGLINRRAKERALCLSGVNKGAS